MVLRCNLLKGNGLERRINVGTELRTRLGRILDKSRKDSVRSQDVSEKLSGLSRVRNLDWKEGLRI